MKQKWILLLAFVPTVVGYAYSATFMMRFAVPGLGELLHWLFPLAVLLFWFWAGRRYADSGLKAVPALLLSHWVGILSLVVYVWQFWFVSDGARNMTLAVFSQCFNSLTPLTAGLAIKFEPVANVMSGHSKIAVQVLGLLLMAVDFFGGFLLRRHQNKRAAG